jgi:hypothetical protein
MVGMCLLKGPWAENGLESLESLCVGVRGVQWLTEEPIM